MVTYYREDGTTTECSNNLWDADGAVEQSQISSHVTVALQCIGDEGKWHRQHSSPRTANHEEGNELQILVVDIRNHAETNGSDNQTDRIGQLRVLEMRQQGSPYNGAHSLDSKEDARPVACLLEGLARGISGIPHHLSDRARRVVPHIEHRSP